MTPAPRYGRARPARPWGPIPASVAIVLGWWLVAHSSGQGWVQDLGDFVAAGVLIGVIGPWVALRRVRVNVLAAPIDGQAGVPIELVVASSRPARLTPLSPAGEPRLSGPMILRPAGRGVFHTVTVEVATAAPFGLQWWTRRVELPLANPLSVAPRRGPGAPVPESPPEEVGDAGGAGRRSGPQGDLRAPRPYRPGDARRLVHWPASAHTGEMMVRELEHPPGRPAEMRVALPRGAEEAEREAERAMGTVAALLERGVPVILTTDEPGGVRTALVGNQRDAGRRLAAAIAPADRR